MLLPRDLQLGSEGAHKKKLDIDDQIAHMKRKGIKFNYCSEDVARQTLEDKTYYFKLAAYRVLFQKRVGGKHDGEYVDLDFGQLRDLASIDQMLRYTLLPMTLDVEHFAKVKLMRRLGELDDEDGYSIVSDYFRDLQPPYDKRRRREITRLKNDPYCGALVRKYVNDMPVWVLLELMSFGSFAYFYLFCADRWEDKEMKSEHYLLRQTKLVRNCAAHSTDLLNGFGQREETKVVTPNAVAAALDEIGINKRARQPKMRNPRIKQITMMTYAYHTLVVGEQSKRMCRERIQRLERRAIEHAEWYRKVDSVRSSYKFLKIVFDNWV